MGDRGWLIGFLSVALALISISWGREYYHHACEEDKDCHNPMTQLLCLHDKNRKICSCGNGATYVKEKQKCIIKVNAYCPERAECAYGASCKESFCTCDPGFTEDFDSGKCEKNEISEPVEHLKPGISCDNDDNCDDKKTHLSCLKDSKAGKVCSCGHLRTFDTASKQCLSKVGGICELKTGQNPNPQMCVKTAKCQLNKDAYGKDSTEGTCCGNDDTCEEYTEIKKTNENKNYYGAVCTSTEECNPEKTFLICLASYGAKGKGGRSCRCGSNNEYDSAAGQCLLGLLNSCNLPTYSNRNPQKCIKKTTCHPRKTLHGKETREGDCVCKDGETCDEFTTKPRESSLSHTASSSASTPSSQAVFSELQMGTKFSSWPDFTTKPHESSLTETTSWSATTSIPSSQPLSLSPGSKLQSYVHNLIFCIVLAINRLM